MLVECDLAQHMGLPEKPNTENLKAVWSKGSEDSGITTTILPPTLLAAMLDTDAEMMRLHNRLKLSGYERDMALFVINHRKDADNKVIGGHKEIMKMYQCLYIDTKQKPKDVRLYIEQVMKYRGETELLNNWHLWTPPVFPISGKDLKDYGCPPGKVFSMILDVLKNRWKESDFTMTKENLIELLPTVVEEISLLQKNNKNKKRSQSPVSL